jgi:hypothetical protein
METPMPIDGTLSDLYVNHEHPEWEKLWISSDKRSAPSSEQRRSAISADAAEFLVCYSKILACEIPSITRSCRRLHQKNLVKPRTGNAITLDIPTYTKGHAYALDSYDQAVVVYEGECDENFAYVSMAIDTLRHTPFPVKYSRLHPITTGVRQ